MKILQSCVFLTYIHLIYETTIINIMSDCRMNLFVINSVLEHAKFQGFTDPVCDVTKGSEDGENFVALVSKLTVKDNDNKEKHIDIIVKSPNEEPVLVPSDKMFAKEIWAYNKLLPTFKTIIKNHKLLMRLPNCIGSSPKSGQEWLAIEDMTPKGFSIIRPLSATLDENHTKAALTTLAEFHGLSYVIKHTNTKLFDELAEHAKENLFSQESVVEGIKGFLDKAVKLTLSIVLIKEYHEKIKELSIDMYKKVGDLLKPTDHSVICHGDYWRNNMLFKSLDDDTIVSVCPIDFQIVRYSSPVTDIMYLLFSSTSHQIRRPKFNDFLDHYYKQLDIFLKLFNLNVENCYPRSVFQQDIKRLGSFGVAMAILIMPFLTNVNFKNEDVNAITITKDYKERMLGAISDAVFLNLF